MPSKYFTKRVKLFCNGTQSHALAWTLILSGLLDPFRAEALEFTVRQVADETKLNREPVISETGLIAWYAHGTNDTDISISDISVLDNGELRVLTGNAGPYFGSIKPQVQSNTVVWVASTTEPTGKNPAWVLKEVPDRDVGAPELPASYEAHEDAGVQSLVPIGATSNLASDATNTTTDAPGATPDPETVYTNDSRRHPSGLEEVYRWQKDKAEVARITRDLRHDFSPSTWGDLVSWQVEKGWPFGWEIMAWENNEFIQLTTNFYYDMAPKVHEHQITWYGWDGHDFEIFLYDRVKDQTYQITSNQYDDVSPVIWSGQLAWEGYPAAESDIFIFKDGKIDKLSDNIEDDFNPRIWNGKVIWQGFDGDDFEIYYYDPEKSAKAVKVTNNLFDDTNPDLRDDLACWMGYFENYDSEIFAWDGSGEPTMLTTNEDEDREPKTAGRKIVWQAEIEGKVGIYLAEPK